MTVIERCEYCRRQIMAHADDQQDWLPWLAEHDGLLVGAGILQKAQCCSLFQTEDRLRIWFDRGMDDGRVLTGLDAQEQEA